MRTSIVGLLCLILPESHREGLASECRINLPLWSFLLGIVELLAGLLLFLDQGLDYAGKSGFALVGWLSFYLTPTAWIIGILTITGFVRLASYLSNREAVGEPWVWGTIRLYEWVRGLSHRRREAREFAPLHLLDRALLDEDGRLVIISPRRKVDWDDLVTIKVGDRFFRLVDVEERSQGSWKVIAHILEEIDENEPIRRLVHAEVDLSRSAIADGGQLETERGNIPAGDTRAQEQLTEMVSPGRTGSPPHRSRAS